LQILDRLLYHHHGGLEGAPNSTHQVTTVESFLRAAKAPQVEKIASTPLFSFAATELLSPPQKAAPHATYAPD
jgi:hypothetical protein